MASPVTKQDIRFLLAGKIWSPVCWQAGLVSVELESERTQGDSQYHSLCFCIILSRGLMWFWFRLWSVCGRWGTTSFNLACFQALRHQPSCISSLWYCAYSSLWPVYLLLSWSDAQSLARIYRWVCFLCLWLCRMTVLADWISCVSLRPAFNPTRLTFISESRLQRESDSCSWVNASKAPVRH